MTGIASRAGGVHVLEGSGQVRGQIPKDLDVLISIDSLMSSFVVGSQLEDNK